MRELGLGARPQGRAGTRFEVWAPEATRVEVVAEPAGRGTPLEAREGGLFTGVLPGFEPGSRYRYRIDGGPPLADPASRGQPAGVAGPSAVVDPSFPWTAGGWAGPDPAELVLYELHVGTFTGEGTFEAVIPRLAPLRDLGVTAIELMPVAEFPGRRNWGYDGVFPFAPHHAYGGPEGLRRLVDAAHGVGVAVVLDVVYNHFGPEGCVHPRFGPYFTDRVRTPWGEALNFDGPESDEVRRHFVENALHWLREYRIDGLRLDATHEIHDESPIPLLAELAAAVREEERASARRILLIAENDRNDPRLVRERERGGLGLDAVWNEDVHHALHAALTGERRAYYIDFGGVEPLAKAWRARFAYDGVRSRYRRRRHGAPAADVPWDRFVTFAQNHDQVGNRARGERLVELAGAARARAAAAAILLGPGIPMLFMGEEYAERRPFLYFVDHAGRELNRAVREGRARELREAGFSGEAPAPDDPATFEASRIDWEAREGPGHREHLRLVRALLAERRRRPSLAAAAEVRRVAWDEAGRWVLLAREAGAERSLVALALGDGAAAIPLEAGDPREIVLATEAEGFGGSGRLPRAAGGELHLPAPGACLLASGAGEGMRGERR